MACTALSQIRLSPGTSSGEGQVDHADRQQEDAQARPGMKAKVARMPLSSL